MDEMKKHLAEIAQYMHECGANVYPFPSVQLNNNPQEKQGVDITTGYYDPQAKHIVLFTHGRHLKDILRSFAHELIHHDQNLSGELTPEKIGEGGSDANYAQNNKHLRVMEEDAYRRGNMYFRDWTDKRKGDKLMEEKSTCCGKCGHYHVKGTSCPKPYLTGKSHCRYRPR